MWVKVGIPPAVAHQIRYCSDLGQKVRLGLSHMSRGYLQQVPVTLGGGFRSRNVAGFESHVHGIPPAGACQIRFCSPLDLDLSIT
jgi:hypothetical protein